MQTWTVIADKTDNRQGRLVGAGLDLVCALGKAGTIDVLEKKEGDNCTPLGTYPFRRLFYRADKISKPDCFLPCIALTSSDGWCDAPGHAFYNQLVGLPFDASHEKLWRDDDIYDLILVIGHNDAPPVPGRGSAIFVHVARQNYTPTEGCVAFSREDLLQFLAAIRPGDMLEIRQA